MPKLHRLKSEKDFARLAKSRNSAYGKVLGIKVRENGLPHSRFGIVAGLKVSKRANQRNLVRRRVREALRELLPDLKNGFDAMILIRKEALDADFSQIREDVGRVCKKIGLLE